MAVCLPGERHLDPETQQRTANTRVAETWGEIMANLERQGHPMPLTDSLIAAIAKRHNLTLVTRNTADYVHTGLRVLNPFL
jgi:toxin FitB